MLIYIMNRVGPPFKISPRIPSSVVYVPDTPTPPPTIITASVQDTPENSVQETSIDTENKIFKLSNGETNYESIDSNDFLKRVQDIIKEKKIVLNILTPCYGSTVFVGFVSSLVKTLEIFRNIGLVTEIIFCRNDSLVTRARNNLVSKSLYNRNVTHILFIDSDITWEPIDILKLILADKGVVGGVYPLKKYNWNELNKKSEEMEIQKNWIKKKNDSILNNITDENTIVANLLKYNLNYVDNIMKIEKNLASVKHIATGFMMIQRNVFIQMMEAYPSTKYVDDVGFLGPNENEFSYSLFDCMIKDGHYLSEDWCFCERWIKLGGEIFIDVSIPLTHTGIEDYVGNYVLSIM